ncbi:hypothetical protein [Singulisphaera sp. PoT]|uniref:hypothetical protein n=1 Tax=Singulisphaera sp. PoT TaxID=3411797 RepID=UPI003BF5D05D
MCCSRTAHSGNAPSGVGHANRVPDRLWIDSAGRVVASTFEPSRGSITWVGRVVDPVPLLDRDDDLESGGQCVYEGTEDSAADYDGVLGFVSESKAGKGRRTGLPHG